MVRPQPCGHTVPRRTGGRPRRGRFSAPPAIQHDPLPELALAWCAAADTAAACVTPRKTFAQPECQFGHFAEKAGPPAAAVTLRFMVPDENCHPGRRAAPSSSRARRRKTACGGRSARSPSQRAARHGLRAPRGRRAGEAPGRARGGRKREKNERRRTPPRLNQPPPKAGQAGRRVIVKTAARQPTRAAFQLRDRAASRTQTHKLSARRLAAAARRCAHAASAAAAPACGAMRAARSWPPQLRASSTAAARAAAAPTRSATPRAGAHTRQARRRRSSRRPTPERSRFPGTYGPLLRGAHASRSYTSAYDPPRRARLRATQLDVCAKACIFPRRVGDLIGRRQS